MFTHKDIQFRTILVINCLKDRDLRVSNGELLLEEQADKKDKMIILTKLPFQKILAIFVIGHIRITTPLIEKCKKFGIALIVMKPNLRPVFYWANNAEANYILHKHQYEISKDDISIAKIIVKNKLLNQLQILKDTRQKDELTIQSSNTIQVCLNSLCDIDAYDNLMGVEGIAAKSFFQAYYQDFDWHQRKPRTKCDALNASLDIGYTILFNYIECFLRMFGFDLYVGVYHRLWFQRKSLVCDIVEPFRCIIDKVVRKSWNRKQFSKSDFIIQKGEYLLKHENNSKYSRVFVDALISYKIEIFKYVQSYYRCFMGCKSVTEYPIFNLK